MVNAKESVCQSMLTKDLWLEKDLYPTTERFLVSGGLS
jgi:hypothetical protein